MGREVGAAKSGPRSRGREVGAGKSIRNRAALLVLPLLLLVGAAFVLPLLNTLVAAVRDPELTETLPRTAAALRRWNGTGLPLVAALSIGTELAEAEQHQAIGALTRRLNFAQPGFRTLLLRTARAAPRSAEALMATDPRWSSQDTWLVLQRATGPLTALYLLRAVDLAPGPEGGVGAVPPDQAIFVPLMVRTMAIALMATGICLVVAYPVAHVLATASAGWGRIGVAMVLAPFWISVLVRSTAWIILLQREGPVNATLVASGLISQPAGLIFTRFAVIVAMVHVLLPFAILPLYGVMRRIDPALLRAASSLSATPFQAFCRVYWPLTLPGVAAGGLITFLLAVGYWVTPALVGGPGDQMVGNFIAAFTNQTLNWGMAAALAVLLLLVTSALLLGVRALVPGLRFSPR